MTKPNTVLLGGLLVVLLGVAVTIVGCGRADKTSADGGPDGDTDLDTDTELDELCDCLSAEGDHITGPAGNCSLPDPCDRALVEFTYSETWEDAVVDEEAIDCVLTGMASGDVAYYVREDTSPMGGDVDSFYLLGDGRVVHQNYTSYDMYDWLEPPVTLQLKPPEFFEDCLDDPSAEARFGCILECGEEDGSLDQCPWEE